MRTGSGHSIPRVMPAMPKKERNAPKGSASIWFEMWGEWIRVKKIDFSRQMFEKFRFFQVISQKLRLLPGKFPKNFDFSGNFKQNSIFYANIGHLQLLLDKLFYFSSKVSTFEHTSCRPT